MAFQSPFAKESERVRDILVSNHGVLQCSNVTGITYYPDKFQNRCHTCGSIRPGAFFQQDDAPPTLPSRSHSVSLSCGTCLDWTRRNNNVATTVARPHASGLLPVEIRKSPLLINWQHTTAQCHLHAENIAYWHKPLVNQLTAQHCTLPSARRKYSLLVQAPC
jgi:hypothetical protein